MVGEKVVSDCKYTTFTGFVYNLELQKSVSLRGETK